jgi:uncharacterized Fe-S center protein
MKPKVYLTSIDAHEKKENNLLNKLERLYNATGFTQKLKPNMLVAVKTHFGEEGATRHIRPTYIAKLVESIKKSGARPFITDTNTYYVDHRHNAVEHLYTAMRHGFYPPSVNAPIVIADGLQGWDYVDIPIKGKHFTSVQIASALHHSNAIVAASHFKGHVVTGFGGAIKNMGIGAASRAMKLNIHGARALISPRCNGCGDCVDKCPQNAIAISGGRGVVDRDRCDSCGQCSLHCYNDAIDPDWPGGSLYTREELQERVAEYALGAIRGKEGKTVYFNFLMDVTPDCDCEPWADHPIVKDIGILASTDMVAIDQASVDLVNAQKGTPETLLKTNLNEGQDKFKAINQVNWETQLTHGENIGLGTRDHQIINVT